MSITNLYEIKDGDSGQTVANGLKDNFTKVGTELDKKVDAVTGKGLSTNDYTTTEKTKLSGLANTTVVDNLTSTSTTSALSAKQGKVLNENLAQLEADSNYPITDKSSDTATQFSLRPNTYYKFGERASLTITLGTIVATTKVAEYCFEFISGATATTLTLPASVINEPTIEVNKKYQISIQNNILCAISVNYESV